VSLMNTHGGDGRRVPPPIPAPDNRDDLVAFTQDAAFIVVDPRCTGKQWPIPKQVFDPFVRAARRGPEELWVRKREASAP
jgi:hypothetical protein